jgi:hypothetical protein
MTYDRRVDRNHPSALVFLIDQSASMAERMVGTETAKAAAVAEQINGLLFELVQRCTKSLGELPRPYFSIGVVGYGTDERGVSRVGSLLGGQLAGQPWAWTSDLAQHPLRIEERERPTDSGPQRYRLPIWIDPVAVGGTPMCAAMDLAGRMLKPWCDQYPDSFPPIVINLTDGESTDGDPSVWTQRLGSLGTTDGKVLMFNLEIGSTGDPQVFSNQAPRGQNSSMLWNMSSELPPFMIDIARSQGFTVQPGARGFGCNADFRSVVSFLNVGTSVGQLLR